MKTHTLLLISFLLIVSFGTHGQTRVVVQVLGATRADSVLINVPVFWFGIAKEQQRMAQTDGQTFTANLPITAGRLVYLNFRRRQLKLYVEPKKDLKVSFHADSIPKSLRFDGSLATENEALNTLGFTASVHLMLPHQWQGPATTPVSVTEQLLIQKRTQLAQFEQLKRKTRFSPAFLNLLEGEIRYKPLLELSSLLTFGIGDANLREGGKALKLAADNEPLSDDRFLASDIYFYAKNAPFETGLALICGGDSLCEMGEFNKAFKVSSFKEFSALYDLHGQLFGEINWASTYLRGQTLEKVMAAWIWGFRQDYLYLRPAFDLYSRMFPAGQHMTLLNQELQPLFAHEKRATTGQISFVQNPDSIKSLDDLLRPHRGRAVYIDFWGSWCGPCRAEMPAAAVLKEKYKNQPIDFLYLASENGTDESRVKRWKAAIETLRITGEHFLMSTEFVKNLTPQIGVELTQFPTYALFDKSGKLVKIGAAYPSDPAVIEEISEAMK